MSREQATYVMEHGAGATTATATGPYMRLWASVLALAVTDARAYLKRNKLGSLPDPLTMGNGESRDAVLWLTSDRANPGGFRWCCDLFDLDVTHVRAQICRPRPSGTSSSLMKTFSARFAGSAQAGRGEDIDFDDDTEEEK